MGGGLMQLVAYGAQDIYLTGNPQITFFKVVYRRHTNFSMEEIAQTPNGSVSFGGTASFTISRNGDLVHKMYFEFSPLNTLTTVTTIAAASATTQTQLTTYVGNTILKEIECEIGGQKIDRHYGHWLSTWADLTEPNPTGEIAQIGADADNNSANAVLFEPGQNGTTKAIGTANATGAEGGRPTKYQRMSFNHLGLGVSSNGGASAFCDTSSNTADILKNGSILPTKAQVPLRFWFNRNPGLALPLIALQYHEVKINIKFCEAKDILSQSANGGAITEAGTGHALKDGKLFVQYIYLDTDERRRFAQVSHEYLIEQLQFQNETGDGTTFTLNFNHPVKEIIWGGSPLPTGTLPGDSVSAASPPVSGPTVLSAFKAGVAGAADNTADMDFGSQITFAPDMNGSIDYKFCTQGGNAVNPGTWQLKLNGHDRFEPRPITYFSRQQIYDHHTGFGCVPSKDSILVYSFALKPEEHQPSGTCNFSRIDTAQLIADNVDVKSGIHIYAVNYNVLRIMSGMGGLAYSN